MARLPWLLVPIMIWVSTAESGESQAKPVVVRYAQHENRLSIHANAASLTVVLRQVALSTALDITADPAIERNVTATIDKKPLETALRELLRGLNTVYVYSDTQSTHQPFLVAIRILPNGVNNDTRAEPLTTPETEAMAYAGQRVQSGAGGGRTSLSTGELDYLERRWQLRVSRLPHEQRVRLEKIVADTEKFEADQRAQFDSQNQEARQDAEKLRDEDKKMENRLMQMDGARYEMRERRRQQLIRQMEKEVSKE